LTALKLEEAFE